MSRKRTHDEFEKDVFDLFKDKITLLSEYISRVNKIEYICNTCGYVGSILPSNLLKSKYGCPKCSKKHMAEKIMISPEDYYIRLLEIFDEKILDKFIETYDCKTRKALVYSYEDDNYHLQPIDSLLSGRNPRSVYNSKLKKGLYYTDKHREKFKRQPISWDIVKEQIYKIHGDKFDFSDFVYTKAKDLSYVSCKVCGSKFKTSVDRLKRGHGCRKCGDIRKSKLFTKSQDKFLEQANKIHNFEFDYLEEYKSANTKMLIRKKSCGHTFKQTPDSHLQGVGCPKCISSKGESEIKKYLCKNNIIFEEQKTFSGLTTSKKKGKYRFDFYLPDYNLIIEFNGEQHYRPVSFTKHKDNVKTFEGFMCQVRRDLNKKLYCIDNNINFLEISYKDFTNIDTILRKRLEL